MKTTVKFLAILLATVAISLPSASWAKKGSDDGPNHDINDDKGGDSKGSKDDDDKKSSGGGSSKKDDESKAELKAKLIKAAGVTSTGKAKFKSETKKGKNESRLQINVKIPEGSTNPAMPTLADADSLDIRIDLARSGTAYAVCYMDLDDDDEDHTVKGVPAVEFKVDVRNKKSKLQVKKGSCDTDLATDGIQSGLPAVQDGDTVSVYEEGQAAFLSGTF